MNLGSKIDCLDLMSKLLTACWKIRVGCLIRDVICLLQQVITVNKVDISVQEADELASGDANRMSKLFDLPRVLVRFMSNYQHIENNLSIFAHGRINLIA